MYRLTTNSPPPKRKYNVYPIQQTMPLLLHFATTHETSIHNDTVRFIDHITDTHINTYISKRYSPLHMYRFTTPKAKYTNATFVAIHITHIRQFATTHEQELIYI